MAPESANTRIEKKLDELTRTSIEQSAALGEIRQAIEFQAKQTAQVNELVRDKVGRVEKALDEEKIRLAAATLKEEADRKAAVAALEKEMNERIDAVKATLGKVAMALFTALLSLVVAGVLYLVTK